MDLSLQLPCSSKDCVPLAITARDGEANKKIDMSNPLLNSVVLDLVFGQLSIPELKKARFVCREWSDVGATVLGKRTFLKANKLYTFDGTRLSRPAAVAEKLIRRLRMKSEAYYFDPSIPTKKRAEVITKIITEVAQQLTQELEVRLDQKNYMTAFLKGIRKLKSTKLRHVFVGIDIVISSWRKTTAALKELAVQPALTSFQFKQQFYDDFAFTSRSSTYDHLTYQPFLQIWLDAAPNLTVLKISANFFPDLEGCKSIKVFEFEFVQIPDVPLGGLNLTAVAGMLAQIKDTVVEVKLTYDPDEVVYHYQKDMLDLPVMSNVVTLYAADLYQIHDSLDETRLPKLKNLTVDKFYQISDLSTPQKSPYKRHRGVESFTMTMEGKCKWENFSETIVQLFPKVKRFDFTWYIPMVKIDQFATFLEPFTGWNLEEASVVLSYMDVPGGQIMLAVLRSMATWQGAKTATFCSVDRADFTAHVDDLIQYSSGFKIVKIRDVSYPPDTEFINEMRSIFEARNAPISIKRDRW